MRWVNRSAILELIGQYSPIARSETNRLLELSMPSAIRIVDELIENGLARSSGEPAGDSRRPRQLLEYNKSGSAVIGVDLDGTKLHGALANIGGEILGEVSKSKHATSGDESFALVQAAIIGGGFMGVTHTEALRRLSVPVVGMLGCFTDESESFTIIFPSVISTFNLPSKTSGWPPQVSALKSHSAKCL
jgi:hypothetical protein